MRDAVLAARPARAETSRFYVWMAAACVLIAFAGFAPTYWLQLPAGTVRATPLLHVHAALCSAWPLYLLLQTALAARGRVASHRAWGLLGISLATAIVLIGIAVADDVLKTRLAAGYGDRARAFHIAAITIIGSFGGFVAAAIAYVRRPEIHKRLMLFATASMLAPAVARFFFLASVGMHAGLRPGIGPPRTVEGVLLPALVADVLIVAGMVHDLRTRGRPHPAYLIGGVIVLAIQILRIPLSATSWWYGVADVMARLSG